MTSNSFKAPRLQPPHPIQHTHIEFPFYFDISTNFSFKASLVVYWLFFLFLIPFWLQKGTKATERAFPKIWYIRTDEWKMQKPLENTLRTHKPGENMLSVMSNMPMLQACVLRSREGKHVEKQQPRQQFLKRRTNYFDYLLFSHELPCQVVYSSGL